MGGIGSGRGRGYGRRTVEDCIVRLDMQWLHRELVVGASRQVLLGSADYFSHEWVPLVLAQIDAQTLACWSLRLIYTHVDTYERLDYRIQLRTTRPYYGGVRLWFQCPLITNGIPCRRMVRTLHLVSGRRYFGCRTCHGLTYTSCQESHTCRITDKVDKWLIQYQRDLRPRGMADLRPCPIELWA
jgi:hypothetical protein